MKGLEGDCVGDICVDSDVKRREMRMAAERQLRHFRFVCHCSRARNGLGLVISCAELITNGQLK